MKITGEIFHASFFFVDIVGLSKPELSTQTQAKKIIFLNDCIKECFTFKDTPTDEKLVQPTGDGMLIAFQNGLEKPVKLAIEVHQRILEYNKNKEGTEQIKLRIGCNVGNVFAIKDLEDNLTIWGPGVIIARRVMDLGDSGHILMSSIMVERLYELSEDYKKIIHPLRDYTIKHQDVILLYSVYGDNFGNTKSPKLKMVKSIDQSDYIHELRKNIFKTPASKDEVSIHGVGNLLTQFARCCKPVPGDAIVGFITINSGISIHKRSCSNILSLPEDKCQRLIEVEWGQQAGSVYPVEISMMSYERTGLMQDISTILANLKVNLLNINSNTNRDEQIVHTRMTIEIHSVDELVVIIDKLSSVPNVQEVRRIA